MRKPIVAFLVGCLVGAVVPTFVAYNLVLEARHVARALTAESEAARHAADEAQERLMRVEANAAARAWKKP